MLIRKKITHLYKDLDNFKTKIKNKLASAQFH